MEGEGGGEDEGGEGVAFCQQTEGEEPTSAWENFASTLIDLSTNLSNQNLNQFDLSNSNLKQFNSEKNNSNVKQLEN